MAAGDFVDAVRFPVVIIGAGAAGLIAALVAREAGAEVLVLERDAMPSGSTALSAGLVPAAGTRWQREAGIEDTPAAFARDIMAKAEFTPDPGLVRCVTETVGPALEWLADRHGLGFSVITDFSYPGHGARRMHGMARRAGSELMEALRQAAEMAGVEILCDAHVLNLFDDGAGSVNGVAYRRPDGSTEEVGCDALVLACNGYGGNQAMVAAHIPELGEALYFGHPGNQGDAVIWGTRLGAAIRDMSGHQGHGSVAHPAGILITWATITAGGVQVNLAGERFSNEMHGYSEQAAIVLRQPEGVAWTIFDTRIAAIARQFEDFRTAAQMGAVVEAADIDALARVIRVPAAALRATLEEAAALSEAAGRDRFGRDFEGAVALAPPYLAVRVTGALFHTQGGLVVDDAARVLRADGTALPNLFAAGGAAAGVSGAKASGYLSGNGLLVAVALGYMAGKMAAVSATSGFRADRA